MKHEVRATQALKQDWMVAVMRIRELDGLRGIAVLAVVSQHYFSWVPFSIFRYGWFGVDLFFVLSGFLITNILLRMRSETNYFGVFYTRRSLRIFPPYYLMLTIYLVAAIVVGVSVPWSFWMQYIFYFTSLSLGQPQILHAIPLVFPYYISFGLVVLWSLSVEEIYYLLWAPIVRFTSQKSLSFILLLMLVTAPLLRFLFHTPNSPEVYTFYCRMDGLAYGSAVALFISWCRTRQSHWLASKKLLAGVTCLVAFSTLAFWLIVGPGTGARLNSVLGIALADLSFALIACNLILANGSNMPWIRLFRLKFLRSIGMVSYTLYLCHYPFYALAVRITHALPGSSLRLTLLADLLGLLISFAFAYSLWYLMESRILRWKNRVVVSNHHPRQLALVNAQDISFD